MRTAKVVGVAVGVLLAVVLCGHVGCNPPKPKPSCRILVPFETLFQAHASEFDYEEHLARAEQGDGLAISQLLRITLELDASGADGHGCVLVMLLPIVGDVRFAAAARGEPTRVKTLVEHLLEGGELEIQPPRPLREAYPLTFKALQPSSLNEGGSR